MIVIVCSFLALLANAAKKDENVYGINGCEATPMPRVQIQKPVSEFFYSFQIDDIPGFEHNKAENTVKLPMAELLTGWYYHEASVFDLVDAGVVEWYFFPNPVSLFTHANWGTAENLMTVMKEGTIDLARKADIQRMKKAKKAADSSEYVWENADKDRRYKVNAHALGTKAQLQFADLSFDQKQTDKVIAEPIDVPDFAPLQKKMKDALVDVDFPLSPGDHEDLKVATNCLHGESPDYNDEYLIIELEKERVYHKGQTLFPLKTWTNVAGRSWWKIDEEMGTLDLYYKGFQMGYLDAKQPIKTLKYFQSPPLMEKDARKNVDAPPLGNANLQYPFCTYPAQIRDMPEDTHMFWEPLSEVCTQEMLDKFQKLIMKADFNTLVVDKNNLIKGTKLINAATDYVMCGNNYLRSYIKYSHGYDFLEAGAFIHYLLEFTPKFTVPFLTHSDLNKFKVDYIYGKEEPAAAAKSAETEVASVAGAFKSKCGKNLVWSSPLQKCVQPFTENAVAGGVRAAPPKRAYGHKSEKAVAGGVRAAPPKRAYGHKSEARGEEAVGYEWDYSLCRQPGLEIAVEGGDVCDTRKDYGEDGACDNCMRGSRWVGWGGFGNDWCCTAADVRDHDDCTCYASARAADAGIAMVDSGSATNYVLNGFAFMGFAFILYGAYAHYFGQKSAGDNTQLEMA